MRLLQERVKRWIADTFGKPILYNRHERALRLLEEALELAQSEGVQPESVYGLATRVYSRPAGAPMIEGPQVMVTLLGWAASSGCDLELATDKEIERIEDPGTVANIRAKQRQKHADGVGVSPGAAR